MSDPYWTAETNKSGSPTAVLRVEKLIVAKIYLSQDLSVLRISLPELKDESQIKFVMSEKEFGIIDFKRKP